MRNCIRKKLGVLGLILSLAALFGVSALPATASGMDGGKELKYSSENPWVNYEKVIITYHKKNTGGVPQVPAYLRSVSGVSISLSQRMKHIPVEIVNLAGGNRICSTSADRQAVLDSFRRIPGVKTAEYSVVWEVMGFSSPMSSSASSPVKLKGDMTAEQWYLDLTGAREAWNTTKGDPSFVVAVIDTGVNLTHPDLAAAIWTNPGEIPDNGIDDDGNGYIDDYKGWNFVADSKDAKDDHEHGSHVAGIIAATDDGNGITGVACGVKILPLKVLGSDGTGETADIIRALDMVCDYKIARGVNIRAVNMSLGGGAYSQAAYSSIEALALAGIPVFAAAGNFSMNNDFIDSFPANYPLPNVVSIGSLDRENNFSDFTNYGRNRVGVYSYGSDIFSTVLGTDYKYLSGTSMATPMACGVFLLGWSQHPNHTLSQALSRFYSGLVPMTDIGGGRVNAAAIMGAPEDPVVISKTEDVYAFKGFEFTIFGSQLADSTFTLGGLPINIALPGYNKAKLRIDWSPWKPGNLWRRIETPGYASARSPFVMALDVQAGRPVPVDILPANRHLFKDGGYLQLGTTLYMILSEDNLFATHLGIYDTKEETYREFALPCTLLYDWDDISLFEHLGYIYLPGLVPLTQNVMHRFSLLDGTFSTVSYGGRTMEFLDGAKYASNDSGTELYFIGAWGLEEKTSTRDQLSRFNPDTGEITCLAYIPRKMSNMAFAYHSGKLYIAGGEIMPKIFWWIPTNDCFVYDIESGEGKGYTLPFPAQEGQLLFSDNKLLYVMNRHTGDGAYHRILTAMTDLTKSGWISQWEILPSISSAIVGKGFDTKGFFFKYPGEQSLLLLSKNPANSWDCRTFIHPVGTVRPDPDPGPTPDPTPPTPPAPPSSGGGGCNAGAATPLMLILAAPLLLMVFSKRGG